MINRARLDRLHQTIMKWDASLHPRDEIGRFTTAEQSPRQIPSRHFSDAHAANEWVTANFANKPIGVQTEDYWKDATYYTDALKDAYSSFPLTEPLGQFIVDDAPKKAGALAYYDFTDKSDVQMVISPGLNTTERSPEQAMRDSVDAYREMMNATNFVVRWLLRDELKKREEFINGMGDTLDYKDAYNKGLIWSVSQISPNEAKAIVSHEYGHAWADQNAKTIKERFGLYPIGKNYTHIWSNTFAAFLNEDKLSRKYGVSDYGTSSWDECLAENFAAYTNGYRHVMHPDMQEFFDNHAKKIKADLDLPRSVLSTAGVYREPLCFNCLWARMTTGITCAAFPKEIPKEILTCRVNHTKPYSGDHGLRYKAA